MRYCGCCSSSDVDLNWFFFFVQISATALEETKILVWHRDKLKLILTMSDPFLKTVLDHVVARDVVRKLTQVSVLLIEAG